MNDNNNLNVNFSSDFNPETNLKKLSNSELKENFFTLVKSERKITNQVLLYINELETRKLFLSEGFNSTFEYLVKKVGYSESAAYRRLTSARLLRQLPEISDKIESGSLNLTQLSQVQTALKQEKKELKNKFGTSNFSLRDKALDVICKLENQNQKQSSVIIAQEFDLPIATQEKAKIQKDHSLKLELVFNEVEAKLIEKVKALTSHQNPDQSWKDLILLLAKKELKKWDVKTKVKNIVAITGSDLDAKKELMPVVANKESASETATVVGDLTEFQHKATPLEKQKMGVGSKSTNNGTKPKWNFAEFKDSSQDNYPETQKDAPCNKSEEIAKTLENINTQEIAKTKENKSQRKHLSIKIKRVLFAEANFQCQYIDPKTKARCLGTHFLQVDHAFPLAKGGTDEFNNLRVLCQAHNLQAARDWGIN